MHKLFVFVFRFSCFAFSFYKNAQQALPNEFCSSSKSSWRLKRFCRLSLSLSSYLSVALLRHAEDKPKTEHKKLVCSARGKQKKTSPKIQESQRNNKNKCTSYSWQQSATATATATLAEADRSKEQTRHASASASACLPSLPVSPHPQKEAINLRRRLRLACCVCVCGMGKCGTWNVPTLVWETNWEWVCSPSLCLSLSVFHTGLAGKWKHSTQIIKEKRS